MKHLFILFVCISSLINAQNKKEYKHSLQGIKKVIVSSGTSIKIVATKTNQLILSSKSDENCGCEDDEEFNKKTKGLTPIYANGKDNTGGFGFSVTKDGSTLKVIDLKSNFQREEILLQLPKSINISIDGGNLGSIEVEGFSSEVETRTNVGFIKMKNVTGPITSHNNAGETTIIFTTVNQSSPISITANVGEIDVTLPQNTNADLSLITRATVYTNFNFETPTKKGLKNVSGRKRLVNVLNKGGVKITLRSSLGNIYLRKK